jgi:hypothetical protein
VGRHDNLILKGIAGITLLSGGIIPFLNHYHVSALYNDLGKKAMSPLNQKVKVGLWIKSIFGRRTSKKIWKIFIIRTNLFSCDDSALDYI